MDPDRDPSDPFDILGIAPSFEVDPGALARAYLALSARLHPDIARSDPDAAIRAAAANRAKSTLENPESRAAALLARLGGPSKESDRSLPPGFLADMMETRELIENAAASRDPAEMRRWKAWALERRTHYVREVSGLFERLESSSPGDRSAVLRAIRQELNAWRYVERLLEQLEPGYDPADADFRPLPGA